MLAAIAGDIAGSVHERLAIKRVNFTMFQQNSRFTDDSVMTLAVADCLLNNTPWAKTLQAYGQRYPFRGYGGNFRKWLRSPDPQPYQSWGNGSAMRVSPVGFAFHRLSDVLDAAGAQASVSHDHPEGIKGAQAVATAIFLARKNHDKRKIRAEIERRFGYDLSQSVARIRKTYRFDVSCQGSVPQAIRAFLDSDDVEHAIRLAISLGGDADTQACMAGGIAQAFYGAIPKFIVDAVQDRLTPELWTLLQDFEARFGVTYDVI